MKVRIKKGILSDMMIRNNWSQNRMARMLGITSGYMSQLLSNKRYASPDMRERIQTVLNLRHWDEIFEIVDGVKNE